MHYRGGGVGHVGTHVNPAPDGEWMDIDEPGDIDLQFILEVVDDEDEEGEIDEEQEEHFSPEDGEGDNELEDDYDCL